MQLRCFVAIVVDEIRSSLLENRAQQLSEFVSQTSKKQKEVDALRDEVEALKKKLAETQAQVEANKKKQWVRHTSGYSCFHVCLALCLLK